MALKVKQIKNIMEELAPSKLKESYDNVGLMVGDMEGDVTSILVALDCTLEVIEEAKNKGCNFILTHHPLLFLKPKTITNETLIGKKVISLIKNNINVYSSHTNLDSVKGGINDIATKILGYDNYKIIEPSTIKGYDDGASGIGRFIKLKKPIKLKSLCADVKNAFDAQQIRYAGKEDKIIENIAVINGSGQDFFHLCKNLNVDCIITGDTTYHYVSDYVEEGICIIDAGHFITEWTPLKIFAKTLETKIRDIGYANTVIISECTEDPYKII